MRLILLDAARDTPGEIARKLDFPPYCGANLDALHDCLGEIGAETAILVTNAGENPRLMRMLRASARENPKIKVYG